MPFSRSLRLLIYYHHLATLLYLSQSPLIESQDCIYARSVPNLNKDVDISLNILSRGSDGIILALNGPLTMIDTDFKNNLGTF